MNLTQLEIFCAVVERGGFAAAARELRLTQPGVSLQVLRLEQFLGAKLLKRTTRGVSPTDLGRAVYAHARAICESKNRILDEARHFVGRVEGRLTIGASYTIGEYWLPAVLQRFRTDFPAVQVALSVQRTGDVVERVIEGRADVGLVEGQVRDKRVRLEPFMDDELVLVASPRHPWAARPFIQVDELAEGEFLWRYSAVSSRARVEAAVQRLGIGMRLPVAMELGSAESIKSAVEAGLGVGFLSRLVIHKELRLGTLKVIPVANLRVTRPLCIVHPLTPHYCQLATKLLGFIRRAGATASPSLHGGGPSPAGGAHRDSRLRMHRSQRAPITAPPPPESQ